MQISLATMTQKTHIAGIQLDLDMDILSCTKLPYKLEVSTSNRDMPQLNRI